MKQTYRILRNTDGSDGGTEVDPLAGATGGIDTSFPCLAPDRIGVFEIKGHSVKVSEKGTKQIVLKVALDEDLSFADDKPARKGFSFNQSINITPNDSFTAADIQKRVAMWVKSILGEEAAKSVSLIDFRDDSSRWIGTKFKARTSIRKDKTGQYGDQTQLTPLLP